MPASLITIIDSAAERRAAVSIALQGCDLDGEPYEDVSELPAAQRCSGIFMVHDDERAIPGLVAHLSLCPNPTAIIAYADAPELSKVVNAIRTGVVDYLAWPATTRELRQAMREASIAITTKSSRDARTMKARLLVNRLTNREREVIKAVALGLTNREIAAQLGISHRTIEIHRSNALLKLEANNSPEAVTIAHDAGLIH